MDIEEKKDGFDLIEYPLNYAFKAMCRDVGEKKYELQIAALIEQTLEPGRIIEQKLAHSRTNKFVSVTTTALIKSRDELESVYQALANSDDVVMTL